MGARHPCVTSSQPTARSPPPTHAPMVASGPASTAARSARSSRNRAASTSYAGGTGGSACGSQSSSSRSKKMGPPRPSPPSSATQEKRAASCRPIVSTAPWASAGSGARAPPRSRSAGSSRGWWSTGARAQKRAGSSAPPTLRPPKVSRLLGEGQETYVRKWRCCWRRRLHNSLQYSHAPQYTQGSLTS